MQWIAPSEKDDGNQAMENRLCAAADQLRSNSGLEAQEVSNGSSSALPRRSAGSSGNRLIVESRAELSCDRTCP